MSKKTQRFPTSDETARKESEDLTAETSETLPDDLDRQVSSKTGKRSSAQKLSASRPEFGTSPGAHPVAGAFGSDQESIPSGEHHYRCSACGRWFDTETELSDHAVECRAAKEATEAGRHQMMHEDREVHEPDDRDTDKH